MVGKVLEYFGFSKPAMKFVLIGLLSSCLILLESRSLMKVSRCISYDSVKSGNLGISVIFLFTCFDT